MYGCRVVVRVKASQEEGNHMSLKDQIARDIDRVFLNLDGFAEEVIWDGISTKAVVQKGSTEKSIGKGQVHHRGLNQHILTVFLSKEDIESPKPGSFVQFNGDKCRVVSAEDSGGLLKVILEKKRQ